MSEQSLQRRLRERAPRMRRILETRIPSYLRARVSADDILQEVWVTAFQMIDAFREERSDSLDRWLTSLANRALLDKLREARCVKRGGDCRVTRYADVKASSLANLIAEVASPTKSPSRIAASSEAANAIQDAMAELTELQYQVIQLRFVDGLSRGDIATKLDKSEAAVNSLIFNGLKKLKDTLGSDKRFFSDVAQ